MFNWYSKTHDNEAIKESFIDENKRKLMSLIENNKDWSTSSKEILFMIARYLHNKNNTDKYVKLYSQAGYNLMQEIEKNEGHQTAAY